MNSISLFQIFVLILICLDSEITLTEKGLDLSGLDDLLAEVNRRGNEYQEHVVLKKQVREKHGFFISNSEKKTIARLVSLLSYIN